MLPRRNESLDTRPVNAPHHQEHWDSLAIPCVHYVNYNFEETSGPVSNFTSDHGSKMEKMNIEETMAVLTRCSFDEAHRQPIFNLGGIRALAELIQVYAATVQFSLTTQANNHSNSIQLLPGLSY